MRSDVTFQFKLIVDFIIVDFIFEPVHSERRRSLAIIQLFSKASRFNYS